MNSNQRFIRTAIEVARDSHIKGIVVAVRHDLAGAAAEVAYQMCAVEGECGCVLIDGVHLTASKTIVDDVHFGYILANAPPDWYETTVKLRDELLRRFKGFVH